NNLTITKDGGRVLVGIRAQPGVVDVINTTSFKRVKSIPVDGSVHNVYVTPDGRYAISGSIENKAATVIDLQSEQAVWEVKVESGPWLSRRIPMDPRAAFSFSFRAFTDLPWSISPSARRWPGSSCPISPVGLESPRGGEGFRPTESEWHQTANHCGSTARLPMRSSNTLYRIFN